jgi:hypothetical protein
MAPPKFTIIQSSGESSYVVAETAAQWTVTNPGDAGTWYPSYYNGAGFSVVGSGYSTEALAATELARLMGLSGTVVTTP